MGDQEPQSSVMYFKETEDYGGIDYATANRFLMAMRGNFFTTSAGDRRISTSKRRSPSSLFLEEPKSKKIAVHNSPASAHAADGKPVDLRGFTRLPLPNSSPIVWEPPVHATTPPSPPTICRSVSDMAGALGPYYSDSLAVPGRFLNTISPEKTRTPARVSTPSPVNSSSSASATSPSVMPPIYRSFSAPIPDSYFPSTSSPESTKRGSPTSQRLKRMKDKMKEMSRWWNEVIREGEEDDALPENNNNCDDLKAEHEEEEEEEAVHETEEGVSVEKTKKGLKVQIKCPCGKGYHVFFSGKNCYYQLI